MKIAIFTKIAKPLLNDMQTFNWLVERGFIRESKKHKFGWIGNVKTKIDYCSDDFMMNRVTAMQTFDYIATPRILRNPAKKKRNELGRYITKRRFRKVTGN